jgi:hypothetical protein
MSSDLPDVVAAKPTTGYRLFLQFDDGAEGEVDISQLISFDGVFTPLRDLDVFRAVQVNPELGTVVWPGGGDIDPLVLHSLVTGIPIEMGGEIREIRIR